LDVEARLERVAVLAEESPERIVAIVGPTASGKTELAVALAERIGGEIVSVDSVQIYRGFDIGSGKPSADELRRAPHHLVGVLDPFEPVDAALFAEMARREIDRIRAQGKRVVLAGGTFLWAKALLFGLAPAPPADAVVRARHREIAQARGPKALHEDLLRVDPVSAERLHPNDLVRVSRALEVHELTGRPMSEWQSEHAFKSANYDARLVAHKVAPEELTHRIERRVLGMLAAGWIDEVRDLLAKGYGEARPMTAVGYREVCAHISGEIPQAELFRAIVRSTRVFARRQRTWLNHEPVTWI
jgi:tRNA dimethylallyltransferase